MFIHIYIYGKFSNSEYIYNLFVFFFAPCQSLCVVGGARDLAVFWFVVFCATKKIWIKTGKIYHIWKSLIYMYIYFLLLFVLIILCSGRVKGSSCYMIRLLLRKNNIQLQKNKNKTVKSHRVRKSLKYIYFYLTFFLSLLVPIIV